MIHKLVVNRCENDYYKEKIEESKNNMGKITF